MSSEQQHSIIVVGSDLNNNTINAIPFRKLLLEIKRKEKKRIHWRKKKKTKLKHLQKRYIYPLNYLKRGDFITFIIIFPKQTWNNHNFFFPCVKILLPTPVTPKVSSEKYRKVLNEKIKSFRVTYLLLLIGTVNNSLLNIRYEEIL